VFLSTSVAKFDHPYDFLGAVYGYELVGPQVGLRIARILPWLAPVLGVSLVLNAF
jgi:hypothetical protein